MERAFSGGSAAPRGIADVVVEVAAAGCAAPRDGALCATGHDLPALSTVSDIERTTSGSTHDTGRMLE